MERKGKRELLFAVANSVPALALSDLTGNVAPDVAHFLGLRLEGAENTRLGYASNLVTFEVSCLAYQLMPDPTDVATMAGYVAHLANLPRKLAIINRHLAAIQNYTRPILLVIGTSLNATLRISATGPIFYG